MKKKITNNFGLKLLSLGIAVVFWMVIVNSQDPIESRTFKDIPVKILNEEKVTEREKIIAVIKGDTVDVEVEGRRSELEQLTEKDFEATADLLEVSFMDTVLVRANLPGHPNVKVLNNGENIMQLIFDDYVTRKFSFSIKTVGEPTAGYYVGDALASPNIIQISGAKTVLDKVREVSLEVDVSGRSVDFSTTAVPIVYDMNGDVVSSSKVEMQSDAKSIAVNVPILASKSVGIRVKTVGELTEGYEISQDNIAFQPESVLIAGTKEELNKLGSYITLEVDITGKTGTIEKNISVFSQLDDDLTSLRAVDTQMIAVTVTVTPFIERTLDIPAEQIALNNIEEGYAAKLLRKASVPVTVRCKSATAPYVTVEKLNPYVDLTGCTEGTYQLELKLNTTSGILFDQKVLLDVLVRKNDAVPLPEFWD